MTIQWTPFTPICWRLCQRLSQMPRNQSHHTSETHPTLPFWHTCGTRTIPICLHGSHHQSTTLKHLWCYINNSRSRMFQIGCVPTIRKMTRDLAWLGVTWPNWECLAPLGISANMPRHPKSAQIYDAVSRFPQVVSQVCAKSNVKSTTQYYSIYECSI